MSIMSFTLNSLFVAASLRWGASKLRFDSKIASLFCGRFPKRSLSVCFLSLSCSLLEWGSFFWSCITSLYICSWMSLNSYSLITSSGVLNKKTFCNISQWNFPQFFQLTFFWLILRHIQSGSAKVSLVGVSLFLQGIRFFSHLWLIMYKLICWRGHLYKTRTI